MLKTLLRIEDDDSGNIAVDWVVLAAGVFSLGMALTLTATHNANAASPLPDASFAVVSTAH